MNCSYQSFHTFFIAATVWPIALLGRPFARCWAPSIQDPLYFAAVSYRCDPPQSSAGRLCKKKQAEFHGWLPLDLQGWIENETSSRVNQPWSSTSTETWLLFLHTPNERHLLVDHNSYKVSLRKVIKDLNNWDVGFHTIVINHR